MKLQLINDVNTLKSTDNATQIELAIVDEQQQFIDLSQFKMIVVNIGTGGTLYSSETPIIDADTNTFSFTLSQSLPVGTYQVQVHLTTDDDKLHIAPNRGSETLTIEKSFNEVGETVTVMSIQQLLNDMAATLEIAETANTKSDSAVTKANTAVSTANTAKSTADTAKSTADTAKSTATTASTNASNAVSTANTAKSTADTAKTTADGLAASIATANTTASDAKTIAQQANTTASSANTKSDNAVSTANSANTTAQSANTKADNAVNTANTAKTTADKVRADFNTLVITDATAEVVNARTSTSGTTYSNLKERIDADVKFFVDNTVSATKLPSEFNIGVTYSKLRTDSTKTFFNSWQTTATTLLAVTLNNSVPYDYEVVTKRLREKNENGDVHKSIQTVSIYSRSTAISGKKIFEFIRSEKNNYSDEWGEWQVVVIPVSCNGNPEGIITAWYGVIAYDITNGKYYRKTTGASSATNTGWQLLGDNYVLPDATTTAKGGVVLDNTVTSTSTTKAATANAVKTVNDSIKFFVDNTVTLNTAPLYFQLGTTVSFSTSLQREIIAVINDILQISAVSPALTIELETKKHFNNAYTRQHISIFGSTTTIKGALFFSLRRSSQSSEGTAWEKWELETHSVKVTGNPEGLINGLIGMKVYDITSGKTYRKTTGAYPATNTGWVEI